METSRGEELAEELAAIKPVRASSLAGCNLPVDGLVGPDIGLRGPGRVAEASIYSRNSSSSSSSSNRNRNKSAVAVVQAMGAVADPVTDQSSSKE